MSVVADQWLPGFRLPLRQSEAGPHGLLTFQKSTSKVGWEMPGLPRLVDKVQGSLSWPWLITMSTAAQIMLAGRNWICNARSTQLLQAGSLWTCLSAHFTDVSEPNTASQHAVSNLSRKSIAAIRRCSFQVSLGQVRCEHLLAAKHEHSMSDLRLYMGQEDRKLGQNR